jgi:hypothetical protein
MGDSSLVRTLRALTLGTLAFVASPKSALASPPDPAPVELPHYESPPATATKPAKLPPLHVPRDGKGLLAFGSLFMIGGAAATGLGIGAWVDGFPGVGLAGTLVGVHALGFGLAATLVGVKRQRNHRKWLAATQLQPPRSGLGLLGAGTALMMGSVGVLLVSIVSDWQTTTWLFPAGTAAGTTGLAIGATTLVVGSVRHHRFERWRTEQVRDMLPTFSIGPHGVHLGLSGRF